MQSCVLDGAVIGEYSLVAAGAVVAPGTHVPAGSLVMGSPARVKRQLTDEEINELGLDTNLDNTE
jgi:carbonic anhydrase/acetyltransferase-like protein (isoleucine patch superfamily)